MAGGNASARRLRGLERYRGRLCGDPLGAGNRLLQAARKGPNRSLPFEWDARWFRDHPVARPAVARPAVARTVAAVLIRSPWPSLRPYPEEPACADLRRGAEQCPDKIALIDAAGIRSTYRDLWDGARRAAALLQRQADLAPGETVALGAAGTREFVVAMYGAFLAGARVTTFNTNLKE